MPKAIGKRSSTSIKQLAKLG